MTALTLIAEPFPDWEAAQHAAAARDLAAAVAATAPRTCSARFLVARGAEIPEFTSPLLRAEHLPMSAKALPLVWRSGSSARPLDGEFVHAITPLVPIRSREEDDGSQTSVLVPHSIAWDAPELLGKNLARAYRSFVRRAAKYADVILTPTHATAEALQQHFGADLPVQVFPLAPPSDFLAAGDAAERVAALGLPDTYAVTTATPGEHGRLEWVFDALRSDPSLPPVVILTGLDPEPQKTPQQKTGAEQPAPSVVPADLQGRAVAVESRELADVGAILSRASLLLQPQSYSSTGYLLLGAFAASVPVLHAGHPATTEIVFEAGTAAETSADFSAALSRIMRDAGELERLSVLARDRGRSFSWRNTAWQLWETHANI